MKKSSFVVASLLVAAMASMAFAQDAKKKPEVKGEKPKAVAKGEKPKASPGWVVIEEDWSLPFLFDVSTSLHNAREHYRAKEDKSASAEIDKAIAWLKFAQDHATKSTAEDLSTARVDLMDFSASLRIANSITSRFPAQVV
jgi:hypothetical protein